MLGYVCFVCCGKVGVWLLCCLWWKVLVYLVVFVFEELDEVVWFVEVDVIVYGSFIYMGGLVW